MCSFKSKFLTVALVAIAICPNAFALTPEVSDLVEIHLVVTKGNTTVNDSAIMTFSNKPQVWRDGKIIRYISSSSKSSDGSVSSFTNEVFVGTAAAYQPRTNKDPAQVGVSITDLEGISQFEHDGNAIEMPNLTTVSAYIPVASGKTFTVEKRGYSISATERVVTNETIQ